MPKKLIPEMTNGEIVRRFETLQKQSNKLTDKFIDRGLGYLKLSDMRDRVSICTLSARQVKISDEMGSLSREAENRYGPGFIYVGQLRLKK